MKSVLLHVTFAVLCAFMWIASVSGAETSAQLPFKGTTASSLEKPKPVPVPSTTPAIVCKPIAEGFLGYLNMVKLPEILKLPGVKGVLFETDVDKCISKDEAIVKVVLHLRVGLKDKDGKPLPDSCGLMASKVHIVITDGVAEATNQENLPVEEEACK